MKRYFLIPKINFEISWLKGHLQPEDTILPLTLSTFVCLKDVFPHVSAVEEWIPYTDIRRLAFRANEINQAFSAESCQRHTFEGYDWPQICRSMQDLFFRDILLAKDSPQFYEEIREKCERFKLGDLHPAEMTLAQRLRATEAGETIFNTKPGVQTAVSA
jgi:hypothetical protein